MLQTYSSMYKFDTSNVLACLSVKSLNLYDLPQYCKLDFNENKLIIFLWFSKMNINFQLKFELKNNRKIYL